MVEKNTADFGLTPEEKVAGLILDRHKLSPPVDVVALASSYAAVAERKFPVPADAVVIRHPKGDRRPVILINKSASNYVARKRFTIAHEIGHITIPWHCGTIACSVAEDEFSLIANHQSSEIEANRFASELLMPKNWILEVHASEISIEDVFNRVVDEAEVSISAARIKLVKCLPPGYACIEYHRDTKQVIRVEGSVGTSLNVYIQSSDRSDVGVMADKFDRFAVDSCVIGRGATELRWWRFECDEEVPRIDDDRNSADLLRAIVEDVYPSQDRSYHTDLIFKLNGFASKANQAVPSRDQNALFGAMKVIFFSGEVWDSNQLRLVAKHHEFQTYMAVKSKELSLCIKVKGSRKR